MTLSDIELIDWYSSIIDKCKTYGRDSISQDDEHRLIVIAKECEKRGFDVWNIVAKSLTDEQAKRATGWLP